MTEIDYKRAYYCLKKWVEEIKSDPKWITREDEAWIVMTCEAEILNGEYLDDKEYEQILEDDKKPTKSGVL